ncbi:MAG: hypothetical protein C0483_18185 [Pirellula sp.]|nr:hypothetical protein [Pirellula sp.]
MAQFRKAGSWMLIAALSTAPSMGCKGGFSMPSWVPSFGKSQASGPILQRDSDGGYLQSPSSTMPDPAPPLPKAEEFGVMSGLKKLGDTVSSPFKKTPEKKTPPVAEDDPVQLTSKTAPPGPSLYVSLAKLQEKAGKNESALEKYNQALEIDPKYLPALLGIARLHDRTGDYEKALAAYTKATVVHPESAAAFNDLGLCYARADRMTESVTALQRAVALDGEKALYRNNLATVLVEVGRSDEAYRTLVKIHGEGIAHYNVGYLLNKRGEKQRALEQFRLAAKVDPNLAPAKQWIEMLGGEVPTYDADAKVAQAPAMAPTTPRTQTRDLAAEAVKTIAAATGTPAPALNEPIPSPIVMPDRNERRIAPVSLPRVVEEHEAPTTITPLPSTSSEVVDTEPTREVEPTPMPRSTQAPVPLPPTEPMPTTAPAATGPKLLGNEQARRAPAPTTERYYVGDRYSTASAPAPTTSNPASIPPTVAAPRSNAAPLPETLSNRPQTGVPSTPLPATVPSTAGARYPASRY